MVEIRQYTLEGIGVAASVIIAFAVAISTRTFIKSVEAELSLLIGFVALLTGLVVTDYVNSEQEFMNLAEEIDNIKDFSEKKFTDISEEMDEIKNLSDEFSELQKSPSHRPKFQRMINNFLLALESHDFFQDRAVEKLKQFEEEMQELANGQFRCNADSHMEPRITSDLLETTQEEILAVSYDEENWWLSESGSRYMTRHESLMCNKEVEIYRIFITPEHKRKDMKEVFEWHDNNDIRWDVISPDEFPTDFLDRVGEFVIYDGELLRKGEPTKGQLENNIVVTTSTRDINQKKSEFNDIASSTEIEVSAS